MKIITKVNFIFHIDISRYVIRNAIDSLCARYKILKQREMVYRCSA